MKFTPTHLDGAVIIEPTIHRDSRGFFAETYRKDIFTQNGIADDFVQENHSASAIGTLRGLHWQAPPFAQCKLIRVVLGKVFDVVVDIRKNSKTYGQWVGETLSAENGRMLYVSEGFAHGFLALSDNTHFIYKVSRIYSPEHEKGIYWNDKAVGIEWPELNKNYLFSDRDQKHPLLEDLKDHDF